MDTNRLLASELEHAERNLANALAAIRRRVANLDADTGAGEWMTAAGEIAEAAHWSGQVRALRTANTIAEAA